MTLSCPLILASRSPRRQQLLYEAGYSFEVLPADDDVEPKQTDRTWSPQVLVRKLARIKVENVVQKIQNQHLFQSGIVLGADSVACCHDEILGKPVDRVDARRMLSLLNGSRHYVYSGLCLCRLPDLTFWEQVECTVLVMDRLLDRQIEEYLNSGLWQGKAGAFGYQDGNDWLHIETGSPSNVVGLPMETLAVGLRELAAGNEKR